MWAALVCRSRAVLQPHSAVWKWVSLMWRPGRWQALLHTRNIKNIQHANARTRPSASLSKQLHANSQTGYALEFLSLLVCVLIERNPMHGINIEWVILLLYWSLIGWWLIGGRGLTGPVSYSSAAPVWCSFSSTTLVKLLALDEERERSWDSGMEGARQHSAELQKHENMRKHMIVGKLLVIIIFTKRLRLYPNLVVGISGELWLDELSNRSSWVKLQSDLCGMGDTSLLLGQKNTF